MFDRILLLLLILLLPLGILASRAITGEVPVGSKQGAQISEKQIEDMVKKVAQNSTAGTPAAKAEEFAITAVLLATESGKLKVVGMAPQNQTLVWVWTASSNSKQQKRSDASGSAKPIWDGPLVIQPQVGGLFTVEVDTSVMAGVVEIRLEQGKSVSIIRYDLDKKAQLPN